MFFNRLFKDLVWEYWKVMISSVTTSVSNHYDDIVIFFYSDLEFDPLRNVPGICKDVKQLSTFH